MKIQLEPNYRRLYPTVNFTSPTHCLDFDNADYVQLHFSYTAPTLLKKYPNDNKGLDDIEPGPIHQYARYVLFGNATIPMHLTGANAGTDPTKDISI